MHLAHLLPVLGIAVLTGCGGGPGLYRAQLDSYENEWFTVSLPGEQVEIPWGTRVDANGREAGRSSAGQWNTTWFPNWGQGGLMRRTWVPPEYVFEARPPEEERTTITFRMGGEEGVIVYEHLIGPFTVTPAGPVRAGEPVRAQVFTGNATVEMQTQGSPYPFLALNQGSRYWSVRQDAEVPPADAPSLRDGELRFTVPADAQPGPISLTITLIRHPALIDCQGFQGCEGQLQRRETFELTVQP